MKRYEIVAGRASTVGDVEFAQGAVVGVLELHADLPPRAVEELMARGHYGLRAATQQEIDGPAGSDRRRRDRARAAG